MIFFYTAITTGLRRGEVCGLRWEDFDEAHGTLHVERTVSIARGENLSVGDTKTSNSTRKIVLPQSTVQMLRERKKISPSGWIFPNLLNPEEPINPNAAYRKLKLILKNAGLPSIRFHDLRHCCASLLLANGVPLKQIQEWLGHSDFSTTANIYAHLDYSSKISSALALEKGLMIP